MRVMAIATAALLSMTIAVSAQESVQDMVTRKAVSHGVPEKFAHAVIKIESNYNPRVIGKRGEYGLGQILCTTAKGEGFNGKCRELSDPETNLEYTMLYLSEALKIADGDVCNASTVYCAGSIRSTRRSAYCRLVLKNMNN